MREPKKNMGASVRDRLLTLAKERNQTLDLLLTRHTLERLLYRISISPHRDRYVLKGAMLVTTWFESPHRPTRDLDLLGFGSADPEDVLQVFRDICTVKVDDGVIFDVATLAVDRNRVDLEYGGLRLKTIADVGGAKVRVIIDIGFGDATDPGVTEIELPVLLDFPAPKLRAYPKEAVIAEKFQAMVELGRANSRMKDFYDVWFLMKSYEFKDERLARAIAATFARRKTEVPAEPPDALTDAFATDPAKQKQWRAFADNILGPNIELKIVVGDLNAFLLPHADAARKLTKQ